MPNPQPTIGVYFEVNPEDALLPDGTPISTILVENEDLKQKLSQILKTCREPNWTKTWKAKQRYILELARGDQQ